MSMFQSKSDNKCFLLNKEPLSPKELAFVIVNSSIGSLISTHESIAKHECFALNANEVSLCKWINDEFRQFSDLNLIAYEIAPYIYFCYVKLTVPSDVMKEVAEGLVEALRGIRDGNNNCLSNDFANFAAQKVLHNAKLMGDLGVEEDERVIGFGNASSLDLVNSLISNLETKLPRGMCFSKEEVLQINVFLPKYLTVNVNVSYQFACNHLSYCC